MQSLFSAVTYPVLAVTALVVFGGRHQSQAAQSSSLSATLMAHTGGRLLVAAVGIVVPLGVFGSIARGALFALVGALIVRAAVRFKPNDASGIDAAIQTLADQRLGQVLLALTALWLDAFGLYSLVEARWRAT